MYINIKLDLWEGEYKMTRNQVLSSIKENHPAGAKLVEVYKVKLI